jgi:hypothetical protein
LKKRSTRKSLLSGVAFRYNVPEMSLGQFVPEPEIGGASPRLDPEPAQVAPQLAGYA